jgi:uncharacterized protein involved in exopolysaccharide biosynthesis
LTGSENRFLLDLTYLLFRRGPRIVAVSGLIFGSALAYNAACGPSYTASMRVLVTPSAGTLALSGGSAEPGTSAAATLVVQDHGQTARNQAELLGDPGLIRKMLPNPRALPHAASPGPVEWLLARAGGTWRAKAEKLGLIDAANDEERLQARLSHALTVRAVGDTDVIKLDFTWNDRAFAASALNWIVAGYQHRIADTVEGRDALQRAGIRRAGAQAELSAIDTALAKARDAAGRDGEGQSKDAIQARLDAARGTADGLRLTQELARRKLAATDQSYKTGGWVGGADGQAAGASKLSEKFADLLKQKAVLAAATPPDADAIAAIDHQISQVRDQNYRRIRTQYSGELAAASDKLTPVAAGIAADEATLRALDARQADIQMLQAARPARLAALADETRHLAEARARIDAAWQEVGASRALSQAAPPAEPDFPAPGLLLKSAGAFGLAAGLASAAWAERRRRTFDRPADIVRLLGIDVLARLDDLPAAQLR